MKICENFFFVLRIFWKNTHIFQIKKNTRCNWWKYTVSQCILKYWHFGHQLQCVIFPNLIFFAQQYFRTNVSTKKEFEINFQQLNSISALKKSCLTELKLFLLCVLYQKGEKLVNYNKIKHIILFSHNENSSLLTYSCTKYKITFQWVESSVLFSFPIFSLPPCILKICFVVARKSKSITEMKRAPTHHQPAAATEFGLNKIQQNQQNSWWFLTRLG